MVAIGWKTFKIGTVSCLKHQNLEPTSPRPALSPGKEHYGNRGGVAYPVYSQRTAFELAVGMQRGLMAGDWIKMRGGLLQSPKVIALSRKLHSFKTFREWLIPGGGGNFNGQTVSDDALRCVTCSLLLRVWSVARECGKFDGDDLILGHIELADLDVIAGVCGFGEAMKSIGWALEKNGVVLPNFKQHNVPMDNNERQKVYRDRKKNSVTDSNETSVTKNAKTLRLEKRREEKSINTPLPPKENESEAGWLGRVWNMDTKRKKGGVKQDSAEDASPIMESLLDAGYLASEIEAAIKGRKDKTQYLFEFKKEILKQPHGRPGPSPSPYEFNHGTVNEQTGVLTRNTRLCQDHRCQTCKEKRERGEMK